MNRSSVGILLLAALVVVLLPSCEQNLSVPESPSIDGTSCALDDQYEVPAQRVLHSLWTADEAAEHVVVSGWIDPVTGGRLSGTPPDWPDDREVVLDIGARTIIGFTLPVHITLRFPAQQDGDPPPDDLHPAILELQPDGLQFNEPAMLTIPFPDWRPERDLYPFFCFWPESDNPPSYGVSDLQYVPHHPDDPRLITVPISHFSRWSLEDGKGGGDPPEEE